MKIRLLSILIYVNAHIFCTLELKIENVIMFIQKYFNQFCEFDHFYLNTMNDVLIFFSEIVTKLTYNIVILCLSYMIRFIGMDLTNVKAIFYSLFIVR